MNLSRRKLLAGSATLASLGTVPARARSKASLGLADVTVFRELSRDYAGTISKFAALGFTHFGFRLGAYFPNQQDLPPAEKAQLVRAAGMEVGVVRFPPINPDFDKHIGQAAEIGAKTIAMTAAPPFITGGLGGATRAAFEAWLPQLAALGAKCRASGLRFAYHTHWWDFMPLEGGESPLDTIVRTMSPADIGIELDLAWCWYGGKAPLEMLARLGPRVTSMHFKDIDRKRGASITDHAVVIGRGEMDYAILLPRIRRLTTAVGYIEVDSPDDGLAAAAQGISYFRDKR